MPKKKEKKGTAVVAATLGPKELAQQHATKALKKLVTLIDSENERVALSAAQTVLDRAHGKAGQAVDLKAPPGGLTVKILHFNLEGNADAR